MSIIWGQSYNQSSAKSPAQIPAIKCKLSRPAWVWNQNPCCSTAPWGKCVSQNTAVKADNAPLSQAHWARGFQHSLIILFYILRDISRNMPNLIWIRVKSRFIRTESTPRLFRTVSKPGSFRTESKPRSVRTVPKPRSIGTISKPTFIRADWTARFTRSRSEPEFKPLF